MVSETTCDLRIYDYFSDRIVEKFFFCDYLVEARRIAGQKETICSKEREYKRSNSYAQPKSFQTGHVEPPTLLDGF